MQLAVINVSSSGDNQVIAAVAGYKIRVYGYLMSAAGSVTAQWYSDASASGTALSGAMTMATGQPFANGGQFSEPQGKVAILETATGKQLNLKLGSGVQVSGHLLYDLVYS